jgi:hypothetical protein
MNLRDDGRLLAGAQRVICPGQRLLPDLLSRLPYGDQAGCIGFHQKFL